MLGLPSHPGRDASPSVRGNIVWYTLPRFLSRASAFLLLPLYTRVLSPGEFGLAMASLALVGVFGLIVAPGVERAYLYCVYGVSDRRQANFGTVASLHFGFLLAGTTPLLLWADEISAALLPGSDSVSYYYAVLAVAGLNSLAAPRRAQWRASHRADKVARLEISFAAVSVATILIGLLVLDGGALCVVLGDLVANLVLLPFYVRGFDFRSFGRQSWSEAGSVLPVALVGFPLSLTTWVFSGFDKILVGKLGGAHEVGIYSAAYQIAASIMMCAFILNKEWQPLILGLIKKGQGGVLELQALWRHSLCFFVPIGALLAAVSDSIVTAVLSETYSASAGIIPLIVVVAVLQVPHSFLHNLGTGTRNTLPLAIESVVVVSAFVCAGIALTPEYGAGGVACSAIFARTVGCFFLYSRAWNLYRLDGSTAATSVFCVALVILLNSIKTGWVELIIVGVLMVVVVYQAVTYWRFLGRVQFRGEAL